MSAHYGKFARALLIGAAAVALSTTAYAQKGSSSGTSEQGANDAKIQQLEQEIQDLDAQVKDLKRSTADQYNDVHASLNKKSDNGGIKFSFNNGRPTISSPDFSLSLRALVQYDSAYYG